ncbi:general secretion pathway protein I [Panacagrimonas perspica]|uniref:Type II secretion system protein I n=1 Tax=Panacagrimonas perspica TaxID=381431 RepID=A0A4R7PC50_9GAMM|nr:type II secretion system minor pseudopilin GspI [Panacagrimonas perspica]TDU31588.1 general secretion pathway protein I [Panacagrimonas perspica]
MSLRKRRAARSSLWLVVRRRDAGFTLIEVLVAVAVLAIAMAAVIGAMARQASNAGYLKQKTVAMWVAHNRLAELQLQTEPPDTGRSDGKAEMSGIEWRWDMAIVKTQDSRLLRVDIEVRSPTQTEKEGALAQVTGFLAQ